MLARCVGGRLDGMAGSLVWEGETAGESRTPTEAGVVDDDAYWSRSLVEGIDVAVLAFFSKHASGKTQDQVSLEFK